MCEVVCFVVLLFVMLSSSIIVLILLLVRDCLLKLVFVRVVVMLLVG